MVAFLVGLALGIFLGFVSYAFIDMIANSSLDEMYFIDDEEETDSERR